MHRYCAEIIKSMDRFWSKVNKGKPNECWDWQASKRNGYGVFSLGGRLFSSHRMSYQIANGDIPKGLLVCHTCDNKICVNPNHLFLGTHSDNMRDMVAKGRQVHSKRKPLPPAKHPSHRAYNEGCRCRPCIDLSNSRKKKWREITGKN